MVKITLIMSIHVECVGEKNACSCWRTITAITNNTQLTQNKWGSDQFHKKITLIIKLVSAASTWLFHCIIFHKTLLFWGKHMVDISWKKAARLLYKAFFLCTVYVQREVYCHWRLCWAWNTVLNIPAVILVCIQTVYSLDYFLSSPDWNGIVVLFKSERQIFTDNHKISKSDFITLCNINVSFSLVRFFNWCLDWKYQIRLWGESGLLPR